MVEPCPGPGPGTAKSVTVISIRRQLEQFPGVVFYTPHSTCVKQFTSEGDDHSS